MLSLDESQLREVKGVFIGQKLALLMNDKTKICALKPKLDKFPRVKLRVDISIYDLICTIQLDKAHAL